MKTVPDASPQAAAQASSLVKSAKRRALSVQTEINALSLNEDAALAQLEANRDAVLATLQSCYEASVESARKAAADKLKSLQAELATADAAVNDALYAATALSEVRTGWEVAL